jgi:hypothetical protein
MTAYNETFNDIVHSTITIEELLQEFDDGFGTEQGTPFYIWTEKRVYFAKEYDGSESVDSVPRFPCDEKPFHY